MKIKEYLKEIKRVIGLETETRRDLIKTENLYYCKLRMLSDYEKTSLLGFNYKLSSSALIIGKKNEDSTYRDVLTDTEYFGEDDIRPVVGDFFVTGVIPIKTDRDFISKEELKELLLISRSNLAREGFKKDNRVFKKYNCGNKEVAADCYVCGEVEYESLLVNVNHYPVCKKCYTMTKGNSKKI